MPKEKMKILHIITSLSSGGAQRALCSLVAGELATVINATVVSLQDEGIYGATLQQANIPVHSLYVQKGVPVLQSLFKIRNLVRRIRPDIIQGWMYHGNLAASLAAALSPGKPVTAWNVRHSLYGLKPEKPLTRQIIRANRYLSHRPNAIIYNSRISKKQHETFGFASHQGMVIPNGFDTAQLRPESRHRNHARRLLGLAEDATVVGHVARLHPMKDHAGFLRSALKVLKQQPNVYFLLIGRDVSLAHACLSGIVPSYLTRHFVCPGERADVFQMMQAMDILCVSSAWGEAFPNVLGEAMALGVPCVTTDVGDSSLIVGNTGFVVTPGSPALLGEAMLKLLKMSWDDRRQLGQAARQKIRNCFELKCIRNEYEMLYHRLTENRF